MATSRMKRSSSSPVEQLTAAINRATRSAKFVVSGRLPAVDPELMIEGLGRVQLPLKRGVAKTLMASCAVAPYGKGTQTLVDTRVRKTFELDPERFRLGDEWNSGIADAIRIIADSLGLPSGQLQARIYKLLVYEKGGFFLPHRDSEKHDRMVASLIVVLPSPFEGGSLVVRHGAAKQKLAFEEAASGRAACFAAFYADCEHEVEPVTRGVRIALAYNLVLDSGQMAAVAKRTAPADRLSAAISSWVARQPAQPLVFALDHHYTQRGLSLELLKGADRERAGLVVAAAEQAGCLVHLAQVSRHLSQFADDGSFEYGYYRSRYHAPRRHELEIGETYEDNLNGAEWADLGGRKQPWGIIPLDLSAIVSAVPIDDWKPTSEDYEGYTGNAGNTLDRWYHRSAIVVWHRDRHFEVLAGAGAADSIPLFCSMAKKLAKTPKSRLDAARSDCIRFARAIVARWPRRRVGYGYYQRVDQTPYDSFQKHLLMLHDRDTVAAFLSKVAEQDQTLSLQSLIAAAGREFGWTAFAREFKHMLTTRPIEYGRQDLPLRDVEWLAAFCCEPALDSEASALAGELCEIAARRFCEPQRPAHSPGYRREPSVAEQSLALLLQAISASGRDEALASVLRFVRERPEEFSLDDCQVPALKMLIPWSRERFGTVHPQFQSWLDSVRDRLERATARRPAPPTDWARPANVDCRCSFCTQLNAFLASPSLEVGRIPARESSRQHVVDMIRHHQCDVNSALERKGSPYSLVLTKTTGSFERAVKRFDEDRRLLSVLSSVC